MSSKLILEILFMTVGGLGMFLLGMKYMSDGLQTIAGNRLRRMIAAVTNNRFVAIGIGALVTCIIQSSSVTSIMVVGFVNSGFMTLTQAIGVIMGANIGTTITGWILVLSIGKYGLPMLGAAALVYRFSKREKIRFIAMAVMGLGMIFFGLELMKDGFKPITQMPDFSNWLAASAADTYLGVLKCVAIGCILTSIVQSSSATLGITIGLAATGVIRFETAAALVMGENIGTTIKAYLAALGATTNAKRSAYAHAIFNIIGVAWITAIFPYYLSLVKVFVIKDPNTAVIVDGAETFPYITAGIAAVHSIFNIANTILFLPFINYLAAALKRIIPDKKYKEPPHLTHLDARLMETPSIGMEQSRVELLQMGVIVSKMFHRLKLVVETDENSDPDEKLIRKVFHAEEVTDIIQKEMVEFLTDLLSGNVSHEIADEGRRILRMADEYESVGDYIANILKLHLRLHNEGQHFTDKGRSEMLDLHQDVAEYIDFIDDSYQQHRAQVTRDARARSDAITHKIRDYRSRHLARVSEKKMEPLNSVVFTDMLNSYRRISDHLLNIAEAIDGVK